MILVPLRYGLLYIGINLHLGLISDDMLLNTHNHKVPLGTFQNALSIDYIHCNLTLTVYIFYTIIDPIMLFFK